MSHSGEGSSLQYVECIRDSGVQTNLSCSRCGNPICPKCMVYTPVGSKCPDCASIGGPTMFIVTRRDMALGVLLGGLGAIVIGVVIAAVLGVAWSLDAFEGLPQTMWLVLVGVTQFGGPFLVATVLRYIVGYKYGVTLRILAACLSLLFFVAEVVAIGLLLSDPNAAQLIINVAGILGFAIGAYYSMDRFKA